MKYMENTILKNNKIDFKSQVRGAVIEVMREILDDPDYGLELTPYIIERLKESLKSQQEGRVISIEDVMKKYQYK